LKVTRAERGGRKAAPQGAARKVCVLSKFYGQATKGMRVDALAQEGDEGRN